MSDCCWYRREGPYLATSSKVGFFLGSQRREERNILSLRGFVLDFLPNFHEIRALEYIECEQWAESRREGCSSNWAKDSIIGSVLVEIQRVDLENICFEHLAASLDA